MHSKRRLAQVGFRPVLNELEDRSVPAGNVTASVVNGILIIRGDEASNLIRIERTGLGSVYVRSEGPNTTTVNFVSGELAFGGIGRGFDIRMGAGDDEVTILNVDRTCLRIQGDAGNDTITVSGSRIRNLTILDGGDGNDMLTVTNSRFDRRAELLGGADDDRVTVNNTWYHRSSTVDGGSGNDFLSLIGPMTPPYGHQNFVGNFGSKLPTAKSDTATTFRGGSVNIAVTTNDLAGTGSINLNSIDITKSPTRGTVRTNSDGTVTYVSTASSGFGQDSFRYRVTNSAGLTSNEATVFVTVLGTTNVGPVTPVVPPVVPPTGPTVAITSTSTSPTANPTVPFTVTFSEAVTGFTQSDLVVTNGEISGFGTLSPTTYRFNATRTAEGTIRVDVPAGAAITAAGKENQAGSFSIISSNMPDRNDPNVVFQPNGLGVQTVSQGTGAPLQLASNFSVYYTGWLASDGTVFETFDSNNAQSFSSLDSLIEGWKQGLVGLQEGGTRRLFIPAALAYGANGSPPRIPGNADLVFEVNLVSIRPTTTITTTAPLAPTVTPNATIPFTVTFSSPVTNFTEADISIVNGNIVGGSFTETTPGTVFTFNVTRIDQGIITVSVPENIAQSAGGGQNLAATSVTVISSNMPNRPATNDPGVTTFPNGLLTQTVNQGTGLAVQADSGFDNTYAGWVAATGEQFDGNTTDFALQTLIQGYQQGMLGLQEGGRRYLFIPAALAYGSNPPPGIPVNADLVFDVLLINIRPNPVITTTSPGTTTATTIPYTLNFSIPTAGITAGNLTVSNGTVGDFTEVTPGVSYTFNITRTVAGNVSVFLNSGVTTAVDNGQSNRRSNTVNVNSTP